MLTLALETTGATASVALARGEDLLAEVAFPAHEALCRTLLTRIEETLAQAGVQRGDIEAIAVSHGPGSYTGLRISIATAQGFSQAGGLPVVGVSTLEALAFPFRALVAGTLVPILDARSDEVYCAAFALGTSGALERVRDDAALAVAEFDDWARDLPEPHILIGDRVFERAAPAWPRGRSVAALAQPLLARAPGTAADLTAAYLRPSAAERRALARGR